MALVKIAWIGYISQMPEEKKGALQMMFFLSNYSVDRTPKAAVSRSHFSIILVRIINYLFKKYSI